MILHAETHFYSRRYVLRLASSHGSPPLNWLSLNSSSLSMSDPSYTGSPATHSRPRSSSVGSVDITDEPSQNPAHSVALQELRRRNIPVHLEAEDRPDREKKDEKPDLIEKYPPSCVPVVCFD